jgi:hypothetical protein
VTGFEGEDNRYGLAGKLQPWQKSFYLSVFNNFVQSEMQKLAAIAGQREAARQEAARQNAEVAA